MDTKIIPPSIGRRIWYWPGTNDLKPAYQATTMRQYIPSQPFDAGIVCVWGDRMVTLSVTDHSGNVFARPSVTLVQPGDSLPPEGQPYAVWMPYQTGQAKGDRPSPPDVASSEQSAPVPASV